MKKINYKGSISEDVFVLKRKEYLSLALGIASATAFIFITGQPSVIWNGPLALGQIVSGVVSLMSVADFINISYKKKSANKRVNNLLNIVSDKDNATINDVKVIEADLTVQNLNQYYRVPGNYILVKNNNGTSSVIREFAAEDLEEQFEDDNYLALDEYMHFLMELENSSELKKVVTELDQAGEFTVIGGVHKKKKTR